MKLLFRRGHVMNIMGVILNIYGAEKICTSYSFVYVHSTAHSFTKFMESSALNVVLKTTYRLY